MAFLEDGNYTAVTEFILLGLTDDPVLKVILFTIILCIYLVTVSGNLSTILLIRVSSQLHHPMYFFLSHLASIDIGYSSSVTPNMLFNFLVEKNTISYLGCAIQLSLAAFCGTVECFLLATMAYDRFMAICNPLLYSTKMSTLVCIQLVVGSYIGGFLNASSFTFFFFSFLFCGSNRINHFYCDFAPLVELSCSNVSVSEFVTSFFFWLSYYGHSVYHSHFLHLHSYHHPEDTLHWGRHRAFSTCTSHLTAVTLFYGTITFIYVMPKSRYSTDQNKVVSVFYMVVIPMLNPLIYSLRSNDIKDALKRHLCKKIFSKDVCYSILLSHIK